MTNSKIIESILQKYKPKMIESLAQSIKIASKKQPQTQDAPFGIEVKNALEHALGVATQLELCATNLDNYIGFVDYGNSQEPLGILVHLDVVPEGTGWNYEPYGAQIVDNKMYGRGTTDDKGPAFAALYALAAVKEAGIELKKGVRIILGCDEESGSQDIEYYKKKEKLPTIGFSPDSSYPLVNSEKGSMRLDITASFEEETLDSKIISFESGTVFNVVPESATALVFGINKSILEANALAIKKLYGVEICFEEKSNHNIQITLKAKSAHSSTPEKGNNAITAMLEFIGRLPLSKAESINQLLKLKTNFPHGIFDGSGAGIACNDKQSGALTASLNMIKFDQESLWACLDIRYPKKVTSDEVIVKLEQSLDLGISIRHSAKPHYVEENSELVQTLLRVYTQETGLEGYCLQSGGGTYAKEIENCVAFGCVFQGTPECMHQPNEHLDLDEFFMNAKIIANAIVELCK